MAKPICLDNQQKFFTEFLVPIRRLANRLNCNEDLLLALAAFEDSWGQDAHNVPLHNIFGLTQAGGNNLSFPSYQACIDYWELHMGPFVRNVKTLPQFIEAMKRMKYNSANRDYYKSFTDVYNSVVLKKSVCVLPADAAAPARKP